MLITYDEKALRVKCEDVLPHEVDELLNKLQKELDECNRLGQSAIGLAAPQIGINKNIAIIRMDGTNLNLVNCKIENGYDPIVFKDEQCLSFPGMSVDTKRFQEVHVTNNLVEPHAFVAVGFLSIAVQHELDHLNQVLFMDNKVIKTPVRAGKKPGPNEPCFCGSSKKYKKCCGGSNVK